MTNKPAYFPRGLLYGAQAGLIAAQITMLLILIGYFVGAILQGVNFFEILSSIPYGLFALLIGQLYGALPAVLIGGLSGAIMGLCFAQFKMTPSTKAGIILGLIVASVLLPFVLLGLANGMAGAQISTFIQPLLNFNNSNFVGLSLLGLPYLLSGVWVGSKLANEFQRQQAEAAITAKIRANPARFPQ